MGPNIPQMSTNDERGYPCPKDGEILHIITASVAEPRMPGAWCPRCHTVWRQVDEIDLADLDGSEIRQ